MGFCIGETPMIQPGQTLFRLHTQDGFSISGHFVAREGVLTNDLLETPILIEVHGLLGHFLARGTPRLLPHALRERGGWSFSINTRLAFAGQMTGKGIFGETIHDIDAAVTFLTNKGFQNIFILGYSLGASMVINWGANRQEPKVKGLILEGIHYSIPDTQKKRLAKWGSTPTYEEVYARAQAIFGNNPDHSSHDETFVIYQARGPSRKPGDNEIFTYKTWWHMMGPEASAAMAHRHIGKVKIPMLLMRGEHDSLIEAWEGEELARIAREGGNPQVRTRKIPHAGHDCMDNPEAMLKEIVSMFSAVQNS
jgi:pimeloyl-ACP methyl ester carboxylesterase